MSPSLPDSAAFDSSTTRFEMFSPAPRANSAPGRATITPQQRPDRLPVREPFAGGQLLEFLGRRAVVGVETYDGDTYERALDLPRGHGTVALRSADGYVAATFRLVDWRDLAPAVGRVRRLLDLDADPVAIDDALAHDPVLAPLVHATRGLRVAGSVDPAETIVRAIVGQQVSVSGARTVIGRITGAVSEPLGVDHPTLTHVFPSMARLAAADAGAFPMPTARAATLQRVARLIADGELAMDAGIDRAEAVGRLLAVKGIGPWTAQYVAMRGLGDPDVFLGGDLGVRHALAGFGLEPTVAETWRPWRSYAMHHLWNSLSPTAHDRQGRT
jgi:AraC family transcriptional regulator, regulatory protein of adaptative response / DNA-3-methyladenine glycosylase II